MSKTDSLRERLNARLFGKPSEICTTALSRCMTLDRCLMFLQYVHLISRLVKSLACQVPPLATQDSSVHSEYLYFKNETYLNKKIIETRDKGISDMKYLMLQK